MKWTVSPSRISLITGWLLPLVVFGWFGLVSRPVDSEDYGWAFGVLIAFAISTAVGWVLLLLGLLGVIDEATQQQRRGSRGFVVVGAIGLCLFTLVLLIIASLIGTK